MKAKREHFHNPTELPPRSIWQGDLRSVRAAAG
jgi:hypothetical protein